MIITQNKKLIVGLIIVFAAILRIWNVTHSEVVTDEASLGFRAVGLIDFDAAEHQPTPWEWNDAPPQWMKLSFHDHPPLFFWIQHISIRLFGENTFALRLPSLLFGIGTVALLYVITAMMFGNIAGYLAAILSACNVYLVWISRIGLQESTVIFFMLLSVLFFLRGSKRPKEYVFFGIALGLAILTKYTAFIIVPITLSYLLLADRKELKQKYLWIGFFASLLIFSPVIIYNVLLYKQFGHFDFQFSYIFGQVPSAWKIQPGKEEFSGIVEKFLFFFINLKNGLSPVFLAFLAVITANMILTFLRKKTVTLLFLCITMFWMLLAFLAIGPSHRFLSLVIPFFIIILSYGFSKILPVPKQRIHTFLILIFIISEIIFSYSSNIQKNPFAWHSSELHAHYSNTGYNQLDVWLKTFTSSFRPKYSFPFQYQFLNDIAKKNTEDDTNKQTVPIMFVYDENFNEQSALWIMHRLSVYHLWPVLSSSAFLETLEKNGDTVYADLGFEKMYFIKKTSHALGKKFSPPSDAGKKISDRFFLQNKNPGERIINTFGNTAFEIYDLY